MTITTQVTEAVKAAHDSLLGGLLRCMNMGASMRYIRDYRKWKVKQEPEYKDYIRNRYISGGKQACSCNYINQKLLARVGADRHPL